MRTQEVIRFFAGREGWTEDVMAVVVRIIRDWISHCGEKEPGGAPNFPPPFNMITRPFQIAGRHGGIISSITTLDVEPTLPAAATRGLPSRDNAHLSSSGGACVRSTICVPSAIDYAQAG